MDCKKEINFRKCNCTYPGCPRKGMCCDCISYHLGRKELTACCFKPEIEGTYDRSFERFIESARRK